MTQKLVKQLTHTYWATVDKHFTSYCMTILQYDRTIVPLLHCENLRPQNYKLQTHFKGENASHRVTVCRSPFRTQARACGQGGLVVLVREVHSFTVRPAPCVSVFYCRHFLLFLDVESGFCILRAGTLFRGAKYSRLANATGVSVP